MFRLLKQVYGIFVIFILAPLSTMFVVVRILTDMINFYETASIFIGFIVACNYYFFIKQNCTL